MIKLYTYKNCGSCKKALKWLQQEGIEYQELPIRETPPSRDELQQMLKSKGAIKLLFNTSGMDYRQLGMKDKLPTMTDAEAIALLASNGNLIKRPFVLSDKGNTVGFKEPDWQDLFV